MLKKGNWILSWFTESWILKKKELNPELIHWILNLKKSSCWILSGFTESWFLKERELNPELIHWILNLKKRVLAESWADSLNPESLKKATQSWADSLNPESEKGFLLNPELSACWIMSWFSESWILKKRNWILSWFTESWILKRALAESWADSLNPKP